MRMRGFTLIELLVTLVILAVLATAAAPMLQLTAKRAKEQELRRALWQIRDAIDAYKQAFDDGMIARSKDKSGYPPTLQTLVNGVENVKDPKHKKIYFLRQIPRDPFNPDSSLAAEATWGKRGYQDWSEEPEAFGDREDVYDVFSLSNGIGLDKRPYRKW